jgi:chemotaxis protein MotB
MLIRRIVEPDPDLKQKVSVLPEKEGVLMRVSSGVMFRPGSAELTPGSKAVLDTVIELLNEQKYDVVVRGHSDNVMPEGTRFGSNWELSAARAAAAVDYILSRSDIKSTRLKAVGYGSSRPLLPNTSEENRAKNRRLEFYYHRPDADAM